MQTVSTTELGEQRLMLDGFATNSGTVSSREEFRGTGGSLYTLRRHDILMGAERVQIEVRDKDSGLVTGVVELKPTHDHNIDTLQGRVAPTAPPGTIDRALGVPHSCPAASAASFRV